MDNREFDAVVVGSGPNGLAAAITLQQQGLSVLIVEGDSKYGGGLRSAESTLPGFLHDTCSAVHPMAINSPFFQTLPLRDYGLNYIYAPITIAHPFDDGTVGVVKGDVNTTANLLGNDGAAYRKLFQPMEQNWKNISPDVLGPLQISRHAIALAEFGMQAIRSSDAIARRFQTKIARGLWAGTAAHSMQPFSGLSSSAAGLVLTTIAHTKGWPIIQGGSSMLANALVAYFRSIGGQLENGHYVRSLKELPTARAILFDVSPPQLLTIAGHKLSSLYRWQLRRFRFGMGVFKIDWALDAPIPFASSECSVAGTIHVGNTFEEIAESERSCADGVVPKKPFVLLSQPTPFDKSRAPAGKHIAWAYCHTPNGSTENMRSQIESQIERFAPGFRERILAAHCMNTEQMHEYNPNYIGGDINGGNMNITQLFTRPALRVSPYRTSAKALYLCSASTVPGGGVHGMCGFHAARRVLKDIFKITIAR